MGIDGVKITVKSITLRDGEDLTIMTPDGLEVFIWNSGGDFTFCNETPEDSGLVTRDCVARPDWDGTWFVNDGKKL